MTGRPTLHQGYPLPALFLLVAVCGVVVAVVMPAIRTIASGRVEAGMVLVSLGIATFCSSLLGAIVGLHHFRRLRGLGWGIVAGLFVGLTVGLLAVVPPDRLSELTAAIIGGACVLLCIGVVARLTAAPVTLCLEPDDPDIISNVSVVKDGTVARLTDPNSDV